MRDLSFNTRRIKPIHRIAALALGARTWGHPRMICVALLAAVSTWTVGSSAAAQVPGRWEPLLEPGSGGRISGLAVSPFDGNRLLASGDILGLTLSTDGGSSWGPTFGFTSWEGGAITWHPADPNVVWVGTGGGPYQSTDGGVHWVSKRVGMPTADDFFFTATIEQVLFDPNDDRHLLAFGGNARRLNSIVNRGTPELGAVWESVDGGDSWSRLSTLVPGGSLPGDAPGGINILSASFAADSSFRLYASVDGQGVYRSDNAGLTWFPVNAGLRHLQVNRLVAHPTIEDTLWVTLDRLIVGDPVTDVIPGGVFKSTDGGANWTDVNLGLGQNVNIDSPDNSSRYYAIDLSPAAPDTLYTGDFRNGTQHSMARTDDGGATWTSQLTTNGLVRFPPAGVRMEVIAVDPNNPNRVFAANDSFIIRTEDGGANWEDVTSDQVSAGAFVGNGFTGWVSTQIEFNPLDADHIIIQGFDAARVVQSKDSGQTWTRQAAEPSPFKGGRDVAFAGSAIYATLGQADFQGVARSLDNGENWIVVDGNGLPEFSSGKRPNGIYADPTNPTRVWVAAGDALLASTDSGINWTPVLAPVGSEVHWIQEDRSQPNRFYVSAEGAVYETTDGVEFDEISGGPGGPGRMDVDALGRLLLASKDENANPGQGLWRYDGVSWELLLDDPYVHDVAVDPNDPTLIVAITSFEPIADLSRARGVYLSSDDGDTWETINEGLPILRGLTIGFDPRTPQTLVAGTGGRGFFRRDLRGLTNVPASSPAGLGLLALALLIGATAWALRRGTGAPSA